MEDAPRLAELANNIKIAENLRDGFPHPYTLTDAENFINMCLKQNPTQVFAVEFNGEYAGNIGLHPETDVYRKSAEIGYFLGEPFWGKGIMTRALKQMVQYGFETFNIVRIHTGILSTTMLLNGFWKSGVLKKKPFLKRPFSKITGYGTK